MLDFCCVVGDAGGAVWCGLVLFCFLGQLLLFLVSEHLNVLVGVFDGYVVIVQQLLVLDCKVDLICDGLGVGLLQVLVCGVVDDGVDLFHDVEPRRFWVFLSEHCVAGRNLPEVAV